MLNMQPAGMILGAPVQFAEPDMPHANELMSVHGERKPREGYQFPNDISGTYDGSLHNLHTSHRRISAGLDKHAMRGQYDHSKAPKAFDWYVKQLSEHYVRHHGGLPATKATRDHVAQQLADEHMRTGKTLRGRIVPNTIHQTGVMPSQVLATAKHLGASGSGLNFTLSGDHHLSHKDGTQPHPFDDMMTEAGIEKGTHYHLYYAHDTDSTQHEEESPYDITEHEMKQLSPLHSERCKQLDSPYIQMSSVLSPAVQMAEMNPTTHANELMALHTSRQIVDPESVSMRSETLPGSLHNLHVIHNLTQMSFERGHAKPSPEAYHAYIGKLSEAHQRHLGGPKLTNAVRDKVAKQLFLSTEKDGKQLLKEHTTSTQHAEHDPVKVERASRGASDAAKRRSQKVLITYHEDSDTYRQEPEDEYTGGTRIVTYHPDGRVETHT